MDGPWPQNAAFFFVLALPTSMVAWAWIALALGRLPDPVDRPVWVQFVAVRTGFGGARPEGSVQPNLGVVGTSLAFWAIFNLPALAFLLGWPYGWFGRLVFVAYFVAQGLWVGQLLMAIVKSSSKHRRG